MIEKHKIKFVFHNPNTPQKTEKYLTEWFAKISMQVIEETVQETVNHRK